MGKNVEARSTLLPSSPRSTERSPLAKCAGLVEYGSAHRDGSWRTMLELASPLSRMRRQNLRALLSSVRDVTKEKKREQQIIRATRLAAMGQMNRRLRPRAQ